MKHPRIIEAEASSALTPINRGRARTCDAFSTFDQRTIDGTGAFLVGELERLDPTLHEPLASVTWGRDIQVREDVSIGDEASSFTNSSFASAGGIVPGGKAWASKEANAITGIALDIGKTVSPLFLWAMELSYSLPELESAIRVGRPIDQAKYDGMQLKHQMDIDEQVYIGDAGFNVAGLINSAAVSLSTASVGGLASTAWSQKTPDEILNDVNILLTDAWTATGYTVVPDEIRLPPVQFAYLTSQKVSQAGNVSILRFLQDNSIAQNTNGRALNIQPLKWLVGSGVGGTLGTADGHDRALAYVNDRNRVRFPMTMLNRTPVEYRSLYQVVTYYGRLGVVEIPYPETIRYMDGI